MGNHADLFTAAAGVLHEELCHRPKETIETVFLLLENLQDLQTQVNLVDSILSGEEDYTWKKMVQDTITEKQVEALVTLIVE